MNRATDRLALLAQPAVRSAYGRELGLAVDYHAEIASTQDRARALAPGPALVVADVQTAGRGTKDRVWIAAPGSSVLASFVLPGPPAGAPVASLIAGIAVARALDALGADDAQVKWPNDVLLRGRKVAGILTQSASGPGGHVIIGVGLNVGQPESELAGLRAPATALALEGRPVDRLVALEALARAIVTAFAGPAEAALDEWRRRSNVLGRSVRVEQGDGSTVRGRAMALDPDGALRVETAYGPLRILAGEVTVEQ